MSQTKQILLAFLIPISLGVSLALLGDYLFPSCSHSVGFQEEAVCFSTSEHDFSFIEAFYTFLVIGLFLTALILPPFITRRAYQSKLSEIKTKSIIE